MLDIWRNGSCLKLFGMAKPIIIPHSMLGDVEVTDNLELKGRYFRRPGTLELLGYESAQYIEMRREAFGQQHIPPFGEFAPKGKSK